MFFYASVLTVLLLCSLNQAEDKAPIHKKGYCIWYDQCLSSGGKSLNCLYNGPAKVLNDTKGINLLNKLCPQYLKDRRTCCSTKQLVALDSNLSILRKITSHCPACWQNMLDLFCESTCSPDQSLFMDPTQTVGFPPVTSILKVDYYASPEFKNGLFDSCKDVVFPGGNEKALNLLCGESAETCTPDKLLSYMGSTANGLSPFDTVFPDNLPQNLKWMNSKIYPCNKGFFNPWTYKISTMCSCRDCAASCQYLPPVPPPLKPW